MTTINKIGIAGIRSFGPDDEAIVRFEKPLTIFLGTNGSGKTTVIECLKMGATGDMPPMVDKGGAFIHDPKLSGRTETRAQIRLAFTDMAGRVITIQRIFQLTNKSGKKQEFKTIESSLQIGTGEKKKTVSSRHGDFNNSVPELMGVSKAILENVIFVHQEESLWPLGDPKRLKDKFDDIFAATRYTKALESIRKYRKEQAAKIKELKGELAVWEERVKVVNKVKKDFTELAEEEEQLISAKESIQNEMTEIRCSMTKLSTKLDQINKLREVCQKAEAERRAKQSVKLDLENQLGEPMLEKSDQELDDWASNTQARVMEVSERRSKRSREQRRLKSEADVLADKIMQQIAEHGKLDAEFQMQEENCRKLQQLKLDCIRSGFGTDSQPSVSDSNEIWETRLLDLINSSEAMLDKVVQESRRLIEESDDACNTVEVRLRSSREEVSRGKAEIRAKRSTLSQKRDDFGRIVIGDGEEVDAQVALKRLKNAGEKKKELLVERTREINIGGLEKAYETKKRELERSRGNIVELREEQKKNLMEKDTMDKIKREKDIIREKERSIFLSVEALQERMQILTDQSIGSEDIIKKAQQFHASLQQQLEDSRKTEKEASVAVSATTATSKAAQKEVDKAVTKLESIEATLRNASKSRWEGLNRSKFEECMSSAQLEVEQTQASRRSIEGVLKYVDVLLQQAEQRSRCPTCDRAFEPGEEANALEFMKNQKAGLGKRNQVDTNMMEESLKKLRALTPVWESLENTREEHQLSLNSLNNALAMQEAAEASLDDAQESLETCQLRLKEADPLPVAIRKALDNQTELRQHREQLELLQSRLMDGEQSRTLHEVESELEKAQLECDSLSKEMETKQKQRDSGLRELTLLEKSHMQAREDLLRAETLAERRNVLTKEMSELSSAISSLEANVRTGQAETDSLRRDSESRETEKRSVRKERQLADSDAHAECNEVRGRAHALLQSIKIVEAYKLAGVDRKRITLSETIDRNQSKSRQIKREMESCQAGEDEDKETLATIETTKRKVYDNIQHRKVISEIEALEASTARAEHEISGLSGGRDVDEMHSKLTKEYNRKDAERHAMIGQLKSVSQRKKTVKHEMTRLDGEGSDRNLKKKQVEKKTVALSHEDLDQYHRSLDQALMAFHTIKMQEINRLIRELWATTYRGKDIDNIEIVSDIDAGSETKAGGKRSYNYRVVMERNGVQLDMRESFCLSCGILALDEPTTNLDSQNIESLAAAMAAIIHHRKEQENFQLIVITHDEKFIELLGAREVTERYYRVSKDNNGLSSIHREDLNNLRA